MIDNRLQTHIVIISLLFCYNTLCYFADVSYLNYIFIVVAGLFDIVAHYYLPSTDMVNYLRHSVLLKLIILNVFNLLFLFGQTLLYFGLLPTTLFVFTANVIWNNKQLIQTKLETVPYYTTIMTVQNKINIYSSNVFNMCSHCIRWIMQTTAPSAVATLTPIAITCGYIIYETEQSLAKNTYTQQNNQKFSGISEKIMNYVIEFAVGSYFNKTMLGTDEYKNTLNIDNLEMSKSNPIKNSKIDNSIVDDDLDDDFESAPAEATQDSTTLEDKVDPATARAAYKKKLAEKKAMRTGGFQRSLNNNQTKEAVGQMMNTPGINEIMQQMMQSGEMDKIARQLGKPNIDKQQLKKMMETLKN